ncbi:class III extradiol dioxygenase subunit B-like domain-containing protein [Streptomyces sp. NPDC006990]|uniref:class III extradiol dioxygenase subunit B-like domain-containing protein n=1 Tax=unclassified Streptomyces TaxID=2593676 RepID=UPI003455A3F5
MLVAAAVCPCPPLLVPEVAGGAAAEMDRARAACYDALGVLAAARPDLLCVLGSAEPAGRGPHPQGARGTLAGFGVPLEVSLGKGEPARRELPPSLTVGAWLLERTDWTGCPVEGLGIGEPLARDRCQEAGRELAARADRVALLVMGDGSNCRTLKAPGYFDERAAAFDAEAARALAEADTAALLALDEELAYELKAAGRSSWQVLAGAGQGSDLAGKLLYDEAPYGVGYMVASWS